MPLYCLAMGGDTVSKMLFLRDYGVDLGVYEVIAGDPQNALNHKKRIKSINLARR